MHAHSVATTTAAGSELGVPPVDIAAKYGRPHPGRQRICDQVIARADRAGVQAEAHCVGGHVGDQLVRVSAIVVSADLVVVGNRGMTGMRRFVLGKVSKQGRT